MKWKIEYYDEKVAKSFLGLPHKLLAKFLRLTELMEAFGPDLGRPHTKSMGGGIFELRVKAKEGIARGFFCVVVNNRVVMLHCFIKKTQKTPTKELNIARHRHREVLKDEQENYA